MATLSVSDDYYRAMNWLSAARTSYFRNTQLFPADAIAALIGPRRHGMFTALSTRRDRPIEHIHYRSDEARGCLPMTPDDLLSKLPSMMTALHLGPTVGGEKELVIDMDLRDHPLRHVLCDCPLDAVCANCWLLVDLAAVVFEGLLAPSLGPPLVVFSGGKGAHIWFANAQARHLNARARQSLAHMLSQGPPLRDQHPVVGLLEQRLMSVFSKRLASSSIASRDAFKAWQATKASLSDAVWSLAWPVVDAQVLTAMSHTVKCPFSVHDKTLRLALPLDRSALFDPALAPRVPLAPSDLPRVEHAAGLFRAWLRENGYKC